MITLIYFTSKAIKKHFDYSSEAIIMSLVDRSFMVDRIGLAHKGCSYARYTGCFVCIVACNSETNDELRFAYRVLIKWRDKITL